MSNPDYHRPVMLTESIEGLHVQPDGIYVDVTFGAGGHSEKILEKLGQNGKLFAFDQDPDAIANIPENKNFTFIRANFRYLKNYLHYYDIHKIDGVLGDFGVSSHQFDEDTKGFSTRFEGPLDMRMNPAAPVKASDIVNQYSLDALKKILKSYGELQQAHQIARLILKERDSREIETTTQLIDCLKSVLPKGKENKILARIFQAFRIEVNQELEALKEMVSQASDMLKPGGRLVFISYHSLEDRLIKNFFKSGNFEGKQEKDFYGNVKAPIRPITRKPLTPKQPELESNNRARSAKLRIAEKIG